MLDSSLDLSLNKSVLGFRFVWCSCALRFSDVPGLLGSAGLKVSSLPPFRHRVLIRL
ncbi:hypothetical protein A2U01_0097523, partial [Trifolium medium]|nr:hypothetical protein [Trifolium medium]